MKHILTVLACVYPATAWAQDVPLAGGGWDVFGTVYMLVGGLVVAGLAFGATKLVELIQAKIDNELLRGILSRLVGSVSDAVAMVNQTLRKNLEAVKDPASPGGSKITAEEKKMLFDAVWDALKKEYGGWDGIFKLLQRIGIGDEAGAKAKIDTMIEAAVSKQKASSNPK